MRDCTANHSVHAVSTNHFGGCTMSQVCTYCYKVVSERCQSATEAEGCRQLDRIVATNEAISEGRSFFVTSPTDRRKQPVPIPVRYLTEAEVRALVVGRRYDIVRNDGRLGQVKVTRIETWVRDPSRFEINVQYGLREFTTWSMAEATKRFVLRLEDGQ